MEVFTKEYFYAEDATEVAEAKDRFLEACLEALEELGCTDRYLMGGGYKNPSIEDLRVYDAEEIWEQVESDREEQSYEMQRLQVV